ncbi:hypothetical protein Q4489_08140 [Thalassotalea sp. 1_MG-2023]|uniref:hypothetical protein n=1 Tax=Thalassotalea sp. 1_MG-2023 TaxID=3062680 RepID=UPI0026E49139|nr:hypothetical protein [Thalassotalea sp. 1_MG-2023]MDO6426976.1 hypothetical protein [Thalassotalea sp. 1_MG-2023]
MKDKQFKAWGATRSKGKLNFILISGVLSYGLPMFIMMAFVTKPYAEGFSSKAAIIHYIAWPVAGFLFGVTVWYITEYKYKKALASRTKP